jgi:RHS repeat-associated protein
VILYYVHADHLNTPRLVTDTSNNIRWRWESDAFGATAPNENPAGVGLLEYNLRFPGQQYDAVVGLHYNYFRDYDPAVGRYVQSDPIGLMGGTNTFAYVMGTPISAFDLLGLIMKCFEAGDLSKGHEGRNVLDENPQFGPERLALVPTGNLSPGVDVQFPRRGRGGGMSPGVDSEFELAWVMDKVTQVKEGYEVRSFREYVWKCKETDPCKEPKETWEIKFEYGDWRRNILKEYVIREVLRVGTYSKVNLPVPKGGRMR